MSAAGRNPKGMESQGAEITIAAAEVCFHDHVDANLIERPASRRVVEAAQRDHRLVRTAPEISVEQPFLD